MSESQHDAGDAWPVVELSGHHIPAGRVSEQLLAATGLIRADAPEASGATSYWQLLGGSASDSMPP